MRRVVVTGMGITSCIGLEVPSVLTSLREGISGIRFKQLYADMGMRSQVAGFIDIQLSEWIDRKVLRFMGDAAAYAYLSLKQAIADAGLQNHEVSHPRTGLVMGSGGAASSSQVEAADLLRTKGLRRLGPYRVTQTMSSTTSACLATPFKIKGINYSMSSACATSTHCIGHAMEQIQMGKQDIVFAGGADEEHWSLSCMFDAMGALSTQFNEQPTQASRAYDQQRDGFVIAGGAGVLVLEEYEHAKARGAKIYAEVTGYGATSDGYDMVSPSGEGAVRCMEMAMSTMRHPAIDYINAHGTSTPVGDLKEITAIRQVFQGRPIPWISSTKSLCGHSLGATGAQEAIYSLLMLEHDFMAASANITQLDPEAADMPILLQRRDHAGLKAVLSNSFGFGGTNACLVFEKLDD